MQLRVGRRLQPRVFGPCPALCSYARLVNGDDWIGTAASLGHALGVVSGLNGMFAAVCWSVADGRRVVGVATRVMSRRLRLLRHSVAAAGERVRLAGA